MKFHLLRSFIGIVFCLVFAKGQPQAGANVKPKLMTAGDLMALKAGPPDHRIAYGSDPNQFGELRLPPGNGSHPVVVLIDGGC